MFSPSTSHRARHAVSRTMRSVLLKARAAWPPSNIQTGTKLSRFRTAPARASAAQSGLPVWAALARAGAVLNLLNLVPVWILDGGQAALALSKTERIVLLTACLALWLVLGENMFFLVALGFGYQVFFAGHLPARPSRATTVYFLAVLTALGVMIRMMPGQG